MAGLIGGLVPSELGARLVDPLAPADALGVGDVPQLPDHLVVADVEAVLTVDLEGELVDVGQVLEARLLLLGGDAAVEEGPLEERGHLVEFGLSGNALRGSRSASICDVHSPHLSWIMEKQTM